jgi:ornithine cyclodeaminase/alanine dehydrogenase-like protein (mu-crystallin family)
MPILLTDKDVRELLTIGDAIDVAEVALKNFQRGHAVNLPRHHFYAGSASGTFFMRNFHGAVPALGAAGLRITTDMLGGRSHRPDQRPFGAFLLFDIESAGLIAVIHDHELQRLRVGAESGVAARHLARADATTVGLLGTGFQAETQLAAACAVRRIESVAVYSPTAERRRTFAERMSQRLAIAVTPVASPQEAIANRDIVLLSTNASAPVLAGSWLAPGAHVTSIVNSDQRFPRRELDNATFARAALVAIGYMEQTRQDQAADIFEAIAAGALSWQKICQLGEILTGARPGRDRPDDITVFKNNGLAVEFVALAVKLYGLARSQGRGEEIPQRYFSEPRRDQRS